MRYFKASLKPFARFMFWGPPSILLLLGFVIWEYKNHPEWLDMSVIQPQLGENPIDNLSEPVENSPKANTPTNSQLSSQKSPEKRKKDQWQDLSRGQLIPESVFPSATKEKNNQNNAQNLDILQQFTKKPEGQLFPPLIPQRNPNTIVSQPIQPREVLPNNSGYVPANPMQEALRQLPPAQNNIGTPTQTFPQNNQLNPNPAGNNTYVPGSVGQVPQQTANYPPGYSTGTVNQTQYYTPPNYTGQAPIVTQNNPNQTPTTQYQPSLSGQGY
jgi:hypothetical protein